MSGKDALAVIPRDIPGYGTFSHATPVAEGWSFDEKYRVVSEGGGVAAIDFDRCRTADPWYDHKRVVFDVEANAAFAAGRIDGYFEGRVPDEFWTLLGVY